MVDSYREYIVLGKYAYAPKKQIYAPERHVCVLEGHVYAPETHAYVLERLVASPQALKIVYERECSTCNVSALRGPRQNCAIIVCKPS